MNKEPIRPVVGSIRGAGKCFDFRLFNFFACPAEWWVELLGIECGDFDGSLLHFGSMVQFDFLYLRQFFLKIKDWRKQ